VRRPAQLLGLTARTACEAAVLKLRGRFTGVDATEFHARTAERYGQLLGNSKGMLMKVGQMLSFAPANLLAAPEHLAIYQEVLARLCADAPVMEPGLARDLLERELGPLERCFADFDREPFAAASIGQVHAAKLHDGRDVAVKIQYPEAFDVIDADLKNTELLATCIKLFQSGVSLRGSKTDVGGMAREVRLRVAEELDYRREASSQAEFWRFYRGHPFIHIPEVVSEFCTGRVLCQEFVEGLSWAEALTASQRLRDRWAEAIVRFVHGSAHRFSVFHADPNPGNYVFHEDGSVSFLDFGCVKRFTREQVEYKTIIGAPCFNGDALGTWQACVQVGMLREYDPVTPEEVLAYWRGYMEAFLSDTPTTMTPASAAEWMTRCFSVRGPSGNVIRHFTMQPTYTLLGRIEIGTTSLVAQLRACIDWRSIGAEYVLNAPPLTEMGKLDRAFFGGADV
jgi:predicted unusual protein kinase regulating ubiquinone biosynthesis (AarF/ABC1/UbiB family)